MSRALSDRLWLIGRTVLCLPYVISAVIKATNFDATIGEVAAITGLATGTAALALLVIATQALGSALVIAGGRPAVLGAGLLGGFTLVATLLAHAFWTKAGPEQARDLNTFFEHMALIGGFILVAWAARLPRAARDG